MTDEEATAKEQTDGEATAAESDGAETGGESRDADASEAGGGETGGDETASDLVERVAAHDEELADEVAALRERAEELAADREEQASKIDDLTDRLKRTQADFQNYKKRMKRRQEEVEQRATEDFVERVLDVRDNLQRAVDQDESAGIRDGVEATLRELDRVLGEEEVESIEPDPGSETDAERHEVLMRVEADRPEGSIVDVYRPGYEMSGRVLRPAQVTVSEGASDGDDGEGGADAEE